MWDLKKLHRWTYLQGRNRDADVENRLVDTTEEEEGGTTDSVSLKHVL